MFRQQHFCFLLKLSNMCLEWYFIYSIIVRLKIISWFDVLYVNNISRICIRLNLENLEEHRLKVILNPININKLKGSNCKFIDQQSIFREVTK